ncbi:DegT/DnrJ/EryC1/StrS family aminotransferase [Marinicrinis lubricantis]|uniref:DegT/DnrJ/EryC1/StrS family aminotransferase n=1 Tax=Marinicrinis lubricantis TaxID=2086470 RepID=A0ABW1IUB6_9BACL
MNHIPMVDLKPSWDEQMDEITDAVKRVLDQGNFILGSEVSQLEREIADFHRVRHGVGVANGTDALILLLHAAGIGAGDEVITTPFTFFATAESIMQLGAVPVFADIDPVSLNLDPANIEEKITPKTKAILPVHIFGQMAAMDAIHKIANKHSLIVIEDACQAIGAAWNGKAPGTYSVGAAFSFFPTKNLGTCGDGGMIITQSKELTERLRRLRLHGSSAKYIHDEAGWNSRLDEIHAAILRVKLRKLSAWNAERRKIAEIYHQELKGLPLQLPIEQPSAHHVYHLYTVLSDERDALMNDLKQQGIGCGVYYPVPLHLQQALKGYGYHKGQLPVAENASECCLSLPLYPGMTEDAQQFVIDKVKHYFKR